MNTLPTLVLILVLIVFMSPRVIMAADVIRADRVDIEALNNRLTITLQRSISTEDVEIAEHSRRDKLKEALSNVIGRIHNGTYPAETKQLFDVSQKEWGAWMDAEIAWQKSLLPERERGTGACVIEGSLTYERAMEIIEVLAPRVQEKNISKEIGTFELEPEISPSPPIYTIEADK